MKRPTLIVAATLAAVLTLTSCSPGTPDSPNAKPRSLSEARTELDGKKETPNTNQTPRLDEFGVDLNLFRPTDRSGVYMAERKDIPRPTPPAAMQRPLPPKERTTNSLQGAQDTATYFAFMTAPAVNTGDTSVLEELCATDSTWCNEFTKRIKDLDTVGSWNADYIVDSVHIENAKELKNDPRADVEVILSVNTRGYKFYDAPFLTLEVYAPTVLHQRITLRYDGSRWLIVDVGKA